MHKLSGNTKLLKGHRKIKFKIKCKSSYSNSEIIATIFKNQNILNSKHKTIINK